MPIVRPLQRRLPWLQTGKTATLTYRGQLSMSVPAANSVNAVIAAASVISIGPEFANRIVIIAGSLGAATTQVPVQFVANGVPLIIWDYTTGAAGQFSFIASAIVPFGTVLNAVLRTDAVLTASNFIAGGIWTLTGYASSVPRSIAKATDTIQTALSIDLNAEIGGAIVCLGQNNITAAQSFSLTGDQAITERAEGNTTGGRSVWGDIPAPTADVANTLTCTAAAPSTTGMSFIAAAWN